jgi:hypothetical protein
MNGMLATQPPCLYTAPLARPLLPSHLHSSEHMHKLQQAVLLAQHLWQAIMTQ